MKRQHLKYQIRNYYENQKRNTAQQLSTQGYACLPQEMSTFALKYQLLSQKH